MRYTVCTCARRRAPQAGTWASSTQPRVNPHIPVVAIGSLAAAAAEHTSESTAAGEATSLVPKLEIWKWSTRAGTRASGAQPRVTPHTPVVVIGSLAAAAAAHTSASTDAGEVTVPSFKLELWKQSTWAGTVTRAGEAQPRVTTHTPVVAIGSLAAAAAAPETHGAPAGTREATIPEQKT